MKIWQHYCKIHFYVQIIVNNYTVSSVHFGIIAKNDGMEHKVHKTYLK